jgi:hypothetical protein
MVGFIYLLIIKWLGVFQKFTCNATVQEFVGNYFNIYNRKCCAFSLIP